MNNTKIIEKIQKILALSQDTSTSEHEAQLALSKAHDLLDKYHLTLADVLQHESSETMFVEEILFDKIRLHVYDKYILSLLQSFFHVVIMRKNLEKGFQYIIVGTRVHVTIAKHLYVYLKRVFINSYKLYKSKKRHRRVQSQAYYLGVYTGLFSKLQTLYTSREVSTAISVYDASVEEYLLSRYGNIPEVDNSKWIQIRDTTAYRHGESAGRDISITPMLTNT